MEWTKSLFKIILGLLLIVASVYLIVRWWPDVLSLIKGAIGIFVLLLGLLFLILGFSDTKE